MHPGVFCHIFASNHQPKSMRMKKRLTHMVAMAPLFLFPLNGFAQFDWTGKLKNPSFESGSTKWHVTGTYEGWQDFNIFSESAADGNNYYNLWAQRVTTIDLSQDVVLPAGSYTLSAQLQTDAAGLSDQHIYVRSSAGTVESPALSTAGLSAWTTLTLDFTLEREGSVRIGALGTGTGSNEKGWFRIDDFRLMSDKEPGNDADRTVNQVTEKITLDGRGSLFITGSTPFAEAGSVDIVDTDYALVYIDALRPSEVKKLLSHVKVKGVRAISERNCQLRLFDHGTIIYPYGKEGKKAGDFHPLEVYSEPFCGGEMCNSFGTENTGGFMNTLTEDELNNRIRSFRLKRGYMVTFAVGEAGWGYQRCFIADDADLIVNELPEILDNRISSYRVFRWDNVGKNGVANILDNANLKKLNCTWTYAWGAGYSLGSDYECVPHMNHLWSTSDYELGVNDQSPNLKTDNEPANSADPQPASVEQELERWPQLMRTGRRLLSPSSFDGGDWWHKQFFDSIDARGWRCDVVDIHCYWNEGSFNNIKSNWADRFGRPVWITEFIWGASWSGGFGIFGVARTDEERGNPSDAILSKNREVCARIWENINAQECVERYAYWNDEWPCSRILWNGNLTPAGEYYAQMKTGPGYNGTYDFVPREWRCQPAKDLFATYSASEKACVVEWKSMDCDLIETMELQRKEGTGKWETMKVWTRPDSVDFSYRDRDVDVEGRYDYRIVETTWKGQKLTTPATTMSCFIVNGSIMAESRDKIKGWTCVRNAQNGYTKAGSGDTYFEVWNDKARDIDFNYYQDMEDLPAGVYQLEAVCFNTSDNVSDDYVNGHVGLYAEADNILYFEPVTRDSEIDYSRTTVIEKIIVRNGKMRIGLRNIGRMTARWAGADNFRLTYLGTESDVIGGKADEVIAAARQKVVAIMPELENGQRDASGFIFNADCGMNNTKFWTVSNLGTNSGEASDGSEDNNYFDKWQSESLSSSLRQILSPLPAGEYKLSALVRGSSGLNIVLSASRRDTEGKSVNFNRTVVGNGTDNGAGSDYQNGWIYAETKPITIKTGEVLSVSASASAGSSAWWSVDGFRLVYLGDGSEPDHISTPQSAAVRTTCYDLTGRMVKHPQSGGIYIEKQWLQDGTCRTTKRMFRE